MSRLTKRIDDKQTYCGYEVKDCKYQQIYDFKKYSELEDYVDCDLTLAVDKLGKLEDLEEKIGCPLDAVFKAVNYGIYNKRGFRYKVILNEDVLVAYPIDVYDESWELSNYKKTWWLEKDKSE